MFGSRTSDHPLGADTAADATTRSGRSLARGPAWIAGLVLAGFGLAMFFESPGTPLSTTGFPDGAAAGGTFLGFETNAWTAWGTTAAGVLVLIGAAQHLLAKGISLLTGVALAAAAVLALIDGDVLGLAAANTWTIVGWGAAAGILLGTALLPRTTGETPAAERDPVAAGEPATVRPADDEAQTRVAPGEARSEPLRRTYRDPAPASEKEVAAARRAEAEEAPRRE